MRGDNFAAWIDTITESVPVTYAGGISARDAQERAILAGCEATRAALPRVKSQLTRVVRT